MMQSPNNCPICGRHNKTAGWRQSHLENENPEYRAGDTAAPAADTTERLGKPHPFLNPNSNNCVSNTLNNNFEILSSPLRVVGNLARTATVIPPHCNQPRLNDPESATHNVIRIEEHPNRGCPLHYVPTHHKYNGRMT
jgi:hypothetical protein